MVDGSLVDDERLGAERIQRRAGPALGQALWLVPMVKAAVPTLETDFSAHALISPQTDKAILRRPTAAVLL